jgi:Tol biopolymer transport system component
MRRIRIALVLASLALLTAAVGTITAAPAKAPWRIALTTDRQGDSEIYAMDADGTHVRRLTRTPGFDGFGTFSPDGRKLVYYRNQGGVWVMNSDGTGKRNLTPATAHSSPGGWSPDSRRIVFATNRDGNGEVYVMKADGSGQRILLSSPSSEEFAGPWSPDGKTVLFVSDRDRDWEIYSADANGKNQRNLTRSPGIDGRSGGMLWSPDSGRIVFSSTRDTRDEDNPELYIMDADGTGVRRLTHLPGEERLLSWSPDGRKIAFGRYPAKPRWAFWVMNVDGGGTRKVTWALPKH